MNLDHLNSPGLSYERLVKTKQRFRGVRHALFRTDSTCLPGLYGITSLKNDLKLLAVAVLLELLGFGAMKLYANASLLLGPAPSLPAGRTPGG